MLLNGEKEAVNVMLAYADVYGYGNFISILKRAWANKLLESGKKYGTTEEGALKAADTDACSQTTFEIMTGKREE